jgi:hypothetical protein
MNLRSARYAQQVRLWIYTALLVLLVIRVRSTNVGLVEFVTFMLIGALFYAEVCPVCGRLSWWELNPLRKWPNALWIGAECRQQADSGGLPPSSVAKP